MRLYLFVCILCLCTEAFSAKVTILCYHTFLNKPDVYSDFSFEEFKSHIETIETANFTFVSWDDVLTNNIEGDNNILISFDDGHKTTMDPINFLLDKGIKPLLSIYPGVIGGKRFLSWNQVDSLFKEGCTISSHGYYHQYLSEKYITNDSINNAGAETYREIYKSKLVLEKRLNTKINLFTFGGGVSCASAIKLIEEAGYTYAFKITSGDVTMPLPEKDYKINRYMMTRSMAKTYLKSILK